MFTDGSRMEHGATGFAVAWKKGTTWKGHKTHMGWGQEAYDTECAAIARALRVAATRHHALGTVTIFTDVQAAIWKMTSDDLGLGQKYATMARSTSPPSVPRNRVSASRFGGALPPGY